MTTVTEQRPNSRSELSQFVHNQVNWLQQCYLQRDRSQLHSQAVATLARLRRGIGKEVGALPDLWEVLAEIPQEPYPYSDPSRQELAAYTAITLYALHQQSKQEKMHVPGRRFGEALRELRKLATREEPVRQRFLALGTAQSFAETAYHARGLIAQLRSESIGMDYGSFANDLFWLQSSSADRVRLQWGRDFYRAFPKNEKPDNEPKLTKDKE